MLNVPVFVCPLESVIVTLYVLSPNASVGVPVISPVSLLKLSPVDSNGSML